VDALVHPSARPIVDASLIQAGSNCLLAREDAVLRCRHHGEESIGIHHPLTVPCTALELNPLGLLASMREVFRSGGRKNGEG
jgi:hypothetical protein